MSINSLYSTFFMQTDHVPDFLELKNTIQSLSEQKNNAKTRKSRRVIKRLLRDEKEKLKRALYQKELMYKHLYKEISRKTSYISKYAERAEIESIISSNGNKPLVIIFYDENAFYEPALDVPNNQQIDADLQAYLIYRDMGETIKSLNDSRLLDFAIFNMTTLNNLWPESRKYGAKNRFSTALFLNGEMVFICKGVPKTEEMRGIIADVEKKIHEDKKTVSAVDELKRESLSRKTTLDINNRGSSLYQFSDASKGASPDVVNNNSSALYEASDLIMDLKTFSSERFFHSAFNFEINGEGFYAVSSAYYPHSLEGLFAQTNIQSLSYGSTICKEAYMPTDDPRYNRKYDLYNSDGVIVGKLIPKENNLGLFDVYFFEEHDYGFHILQLGHFSLPRHKLYLSKGFKQTSSQFIEYNPTIGKYEPKTFYGMFVKIPGTNKATIYLKGIEPESSVVIKVTDLKGNIKKYEYSADEASYPLRIELFPGFNNKVEITMSDSLRNLAVSRESISDIFRSSFFVRKLQPGDKREMRLYDLIKTFAEPVAEDAEKIEFKFKAGFDPQSLQTLSESINFDLKIMEGAIKEEELVFMNIFNFLMQSAREGVSFRNIREGVEKLLPKHEIFFSDNDNTQESEPRLGNRGEVFYTNQDIAFIMNIFFRQDKNGKVTRRNVNLGKIERRLNLLRESRKKRLRDAYLKTIGKKQKAYKLLTDAWKDSIDYMNWGCLVFNGEEIMLNRRNVEAALESDFVPNEIKNKLRKLLNLTNPEDSNKSVITFEINTD